MNTCRLHGVIAIVASAFVGALSAHAQETPDVIFINGKVLTVDADFSTAQAVAVTGNQISGVGTSAEIGSMARHMAWPVPPVGLVPDRTERALNILLQCHDALVQFRADEL